MNILDMMNKLTALSQPLNEAKASTGNAFDLKAKGDDKSSGPSKTITHKGGVKTTDEKGTKHQGKYGNEYQGDDEEEAKNKAAKPAGAARGRGRPRKDAATGGAAGKPDWSAFGAKKDVKLPKWDKSKTTKHSLKDWIENLDKAINEGGQLTATPLPGATAIKNAQGQQVATAATPQAAAMMTKGDVTLTDPTKELGEEAQGKTARIFFNRDLNEYTVKFYQNGQHLPDADYFTDDVEDARGTAKAQTQQEELSERDDREDDEHGGGPTPWENPDQGWEPKKQVAEGRKDTGMRKGHDKKQAAFVAKWEKGGKKSSKPAGKFVKPEDDGKRDPSDDEDTAALRPGHDKKQAAFVAKWEKGGKKEVAESKMSELDLDLKDKNCSDEAFKKQYGKTKAEMRASFNKKPADKKPEAKKTSKLKESILKESHETLAHIINKYKHEVKNFIAGEDMAQDLYDDLYDFYCNQGEMPYGTMKARDGDPYEWVTQRFDRDVQDHDVPVDEAVRPEDIPAVQRKQAGVNFPATLGQVNKNDSMSHLPNLKAATAKVGADPFGFGPGQKTVQFENWDKQLNTLLEGMNVVANTGLGDAPDSVTISATDEDANALLSIVKQAGLGMFGGDETAAPSQAMSVPGEEGEEAGIDVVDDHDGMLSLIRKMSGQGEPQSSEEPAAPNDGEIEVEVDEADGMNSVENTPNGPGMNSVEQADEFGEKALDADTNPFSKESDEEYQAKSDERSVNDASEEEEVDEGLANGADDTFESDIDFMQNVISGGVNGQKKNQSVGNPVTVASTPMKESTDLLKDWVKLSGI